MNAWDTEPDPWQKNPPPKYPSLSSQTRQLSIPGKSRSASITSSQRSTPVSSPPLLDSDGWEPAEKKGPISASVAPNLVGLSKEDKATELARRKEERKQVSAKKWIFMDKLTYMRFLAHRFAQRTKEECFWREGINLYSSSIRDCY